MKEPVARSLEYWAAIRGADTALAEGDKTLTYAAWNEYANMLAAAFTDRGLGADDVIALRALTRMECAVVSRAVSKIDARLLIVDRRLSPDDVRHVLADSGARALICDDETPSLLTSALDGLPLRLSASIDVAAPGFADFFDLFPAMAPERFARAHPPLIYHVRRGARLCAISTPRRIVAPASLSKPPVLETGASLVTMALSDAAVAIQVCTALGAGRQIVVLPRFQPKDALRTIQQRRITHWTATPATIRQLMTLPAATLAAYDVSSLRHLAIEGAPAPEAMKAWIRDMFGDILTETYGCDETGPVARTSTSAASASPAASVSALPHASIEIRDRAGRPLPPSEIGEIWARTPAMIERYSGAASAAGDLRDGDGFFRIGDIGRMDEDGCLFVTGRTAEFEAPDTLLLDADTIEALLLAHPAVQNVAMIASGRRGRDRFTHVFCELRPGNAMAAPELQDYLAAESAHRRRRAFASVA